MRSVVKLSRSQKVHLKEARGYGLTAKVRDEFVRDCAAAFTVNRTEYLPLRALEKLCQSTDAVELLYEAGAVSFESREPHVVRKILNVTSLSGLDLSECDLSLCQRLPEMNGEPRASCPRWCSAIWQL